MTGGLINTEGSENVRQGGTPSKEGDVPGRDAGGFRLVLGS